MWEATPKVIEGARVVENPNLRFAGKVLHVERRSENASRKFLEKILGRVEEDLGAVRIGRDELWGVVRPSDGAERGRYTAYLRLMGSTCVGLCLVERISSARRVVLPDEESRRCSPTTLLKKRGVRDNADQLPTPPMSSSPAPDEGDLSTKKIETVKERPMKAPVLLSTQRQSADLGISRIWVHPTHRRQGIARGLLDVALRDQKVKMEKVAFSQTTEGGHGLARGWTARTGKVKDETADSEVDVEKVEKPKEQEGMYLVYDEDDRLPAAS